MSAFLSEKTLKSHIVALICVIAAGCSTTANKPPEAAAPAREVVGMDWQWIVSRYNNGSEARPAEPALYLLRLEPDGSLRARVDCNRAGGRYRLDDNTLAIDVMFSTRAACAPESLAMEFQRDLGAAANYFVKQGRLYLDLRNDTGTMEFRRE